MTYLLFLQNLREASAGVLNAFMLQVTVLGQSMITYLLLAGIYWCVDKRAGQLMAFHVSFGCWLNQWTKKLFRIERPWVREARIVPVAEAVAGAGGYSMPSGHTSRTVATWGTAGFSAWKKAKEDKAKADKAKEEKNKEEIAKKGNDSCSQLRWLSVFCWLVTALVMFSRNYLGVHTFEDVMVAFLAGVILIVLLDKLLNWADAGKNRDLIVCVLGCVLIFLPMLRYGCLSNAGASFGFLIGWVLERRLLSFETKGSGLRKTLRFLVGAGVLFLALTSGTSILTHIVPTKYAGFFLQGFVAFFIMFLYPLVFHFWESEKIEEQVKKKFQRILAIVISTILILFLAVGAYKTVINYKNMGLSLAPAGDVQAGDSQAQEPQSADVQATDHQLGDAQAGNSQSAEAPTTDTQSAENVPVIVAHRGYSGVAPENTLAAFASAVDIGADMIELDVQETKDGVLVVFHDTDMSRITGMSGRVSDYTYEEICRMDAGSWFDSAAGSGAGSFSGEKIPSLAEVLELIRDSELDIYLELKDIGEADGFAAAVVAEVEAQGMKNRVVYASFNYQYLKQIKEIDGNIPILCNTQLSDADKLIAEYPADYYGLYVEKLQQDTIQKLHEAGSLAFVWTVNTPVQMRNVISLGADGIVTNEPGIARVVVHEEYNFLADRFLDSFPLPALYDVSLQEPYANDYIVQGFTKAGGTMVVSAYDYTGEKNSILYVMNASGMLKQIVDLGFKAHTGGISYDEAHDILWVTGANGTVNAISWSAVANGTYHGTQEEILVSFDAGLVNHNGSKVASFLTVDEGMLYVGSYVNGSAGELHCYDIENPYAPTLAISVKIPERIQGITFKRDVKKGVRTMLLSQGYQTEDAALLCFTWDAEKVSYEEPENCFLLPEGVEQIQMTANGLYMLFESAVRPYRPTCRVPNDQIWLIRF